MASLKFNVFHWHLTDDQGWRIEIKKYPRLLEIGSKRKGTNITRKKLDGIPVSGSYTQDELKEIIEYASERFIDLFYAFFYITGKSLQLTLKNCNIVDRAFVEHFFKPRFKTGKIILFDNFQE